MISYIHISLMMCQKYVLEFIWDCGFYGGQWEPMAWLLCPHFFFC